MHGDKTIKKLLNSLLKNELTAINQFFLHARMCRNWGLEKMNDVEYHHSIKAMKMADDLIERILLLEGLPNLQNLGKLNIGEDVEELLQCDLGFRSDCRLELVKGIEVCEQYQDYVSRQILDEILEEVEEHIDWLEAQLDLVKATGIENYLQSQI